MISHVIYDNISSHQILVIYDEVCNSNIPEQLNIRIIAATNQNIEELIGKRQFRLDLFMRLAQARIKLPPLKDRMEDFDELANAFLKRKRESYQGQNGQDAIEFDPQGNALSFLRTQGWPWDGNIRALKNVVERAYEIAAIEQSKTIDFEHVNRTLDIFKGIQVSEVLSAHEQTEEMSIDLMKQWLGDAVASLGNCTYGDLQELIRWLAELFFRKAINRLVAGGGDIKRPIAGIARIMEMERKQIHNNKEIISLKMKDLVEELLVRSGWHG